MGTVQSASELYAAGACCVGDFGFRVVMVLTVLNDEEMAQVKDAGSVTRF